MIGMDMDFWWAAVFAGIRFFNHNGQKSTSFEDKQDFMGMYLMGGEL